MVVADVHNGGPDSELLFGEFIHEVIDPAYDMERLDVIFVDGDFFDKKLSANSVDFRIAINMFAQIVKLAVAKGAKIRFIKGTLSHEYEQLDVLETIKNTVTCDIKIFNEVAEEELFPNFNVLYVPEEYVEDMEEYYAPYFEKKYDMIHGHGLIDIAAFVATLQESEATRPNAPIFKAETLSELATVTYFGHIHKHIRYKNVRYTGSFTRWCYGESEEKGYYIGIYDNINKSFEDVFVINELAPRYDTIKILEDSPLFVKDVYQTVMNILEIGEMRKDYLRIEIHIPTDYEDTNLLVSLLNESFGKKKKIKLKIVNTIKQKQREQVTEKINMLMDKYSFIFDRSLETDEKLSEYIKIKYGRNISVEKMRTYLHDVEQVSS